jgi:alanine racemase
MQKAQRTLPHSDRQSHILPPHPTHALIDLDAFRHNFGVIRKFIGSSVGIIAVVKANAYGHGMEIMTREAIRNGAAYLGVARTTEAIELRKAGISVPILLFEIIPPDYIEQGVMYSVDMTLCTLEDAHRIESVSQRLRRKARVHLKIDTGMGRLGCHWHQGADFIERVARMAWIDVAAVYSHFATSEDPDPSFAQEQLRRFHDVLEEVERRKIEIPIKHMANTGAIVSLKESHFDLVRPGFMMYGYTPAREMSAASELKPVLSLVARVSMLKKVQKGTSISYGRRYFAPHDTHIATVPIGYGDGYSRMLTGKAEVIIRGRRYPVAGAVSMDHVMVDVGPDTDVGVGDEVTIVGRGGSESISAWEIADRIGTIPYEVLCMVADRVPRVVREA